MQVYMLSHDTDHHSGDPDFFRNLHDIEPTLKLTYSKVENLKVDVTPTKGPVKFTVTGTWPKDMGLDLGGKEVNETFFATRYAVWDSPTHI